MFTRILVPLDGTADSATALPPARTMAEATGGELILLRVVSPRGFAPSSPVLEEARTYLAGIAAELAKGGTRVNVVVREGDDAAHEIVADAASGGAELIVMATHGRGGLARVAFGSVADGVLANSPVPVMLLRPGGRRLDHLRTLLVPVDGTPGASLALSAAVPLAQATGAKLVLAQAVIPSTHYYMEGLMLVDLGSDEEMLAAAQQYVTGLAGRLEKANVRAEGRAELGRASATLVAMADAADADLIVMSTHALTGPMRTLLGSVADEVVRQAHQPVLLVRQRGGALADPSSGAPHTMMVI
jgi:nucleotide-binding universal stress UspA family protein